MRLLLNIIESIESRIQDEHEDDNVTRQTLIISRTRIKLVK
jgi:hypothetical protein